MMAPVLTSFSLIFRPTTLLSGWVALLARLRNEISATLEWRGVTTATGLWTFMPIFHSAATTVTRETDRSKWDICRFNDYLPEDTGWADEKNALHRRQVNE